MLVVFPSIKIGKDCQLNIEYDDKYKYTVNHCVLNVDI